MNIDKFIDENLEEILDNPSFFINTEEEKNNKKNKVVNIYEEEDLEEQDDIIDYQDIHEMMERKKAIIAEKEKQPATDIYSEEPEYYFKLINTYMKFYNEKFNKNENLFSNIENKDKDTNSSLELFFEAIMEFKDLKDKLNIDEIDLLDKYYNSESEEIVNLMNSYEQVYCLEINEDNKKINENNKKIITMSLIICLNYVLVNKIEKWNIFMLKNY